MQSLLWLVPLILDFHAAAGESAWEQPFQRGAALAQQGQLANAEREFEAALAVAERMQPADWRLPLTLHNIGAIERQLGRYAEAERFYYRAIAIWEKGQPERASELAGSLDNLAALNLVLGKLSRAEPLYRRAWQLRESHFGADHALTATSLHGLAEVLHERHRYDEAEGLYVRVAAILAKTRGPDSLEVADIEHNLALLYRDVHRDGDALPLLNRARAAYESAAPHHPKFAVILRTLAELQASRGDFAQAAELFARAVRICEEDLPAGHQQTGIILEAYAKFLRQRHLGKEARVVAERARDIRDQVRRENGVGSAVDVSAFLAR